MCGAAYLGAVLCAVLHFSTALFGDLRIVFCDACGYVVDSAMQFTVLKTNYKAADLKVT